ncbi:MAG: histidine phosphatase family protein [Faecalimonas sp.]|nr:histidine phosphatase family protein [Faecalimonas sp.]
MRLYIIRHGQTDWNRKRLLQGRTDVELNTWGRKVAELTREGLKDVPFDLAITSPLRRAKVTAELILKDRKIPILEDARIIEVNFGAYEGKHFQFQDENLQNFFEKPEAYISVDGSESMDEIFSRIRSFYEELIVNPKYQDSTILISTHGAALSALLCHIKGWEVKDFWKGGLHKNCGLSIVEIQDGKAKIVEEAMIVYDEASLDG